MEVGVSGGTIAVTGAGGFIGRAFCARMSGRGGSLRRFVHSAASADDGTVAVDLAAADVDTLARALAGVTTLVHFAGRAHVMRDTERDPEHAYRLGNVEATQRVASAALAAGVRRFVLASSVKVNGERTPPGMPFRPADAAAPRDAYARSKHAAEVALRNVAGRSAMRALILRLPLVYGPGARGNFARLVEAVRARRVLPFGAIDNRRSLLGVENLLDALDAAIDARNDFDTVHFVADADSVSTPQLVHAIARALDIKPRLLRVPVPVLRLIADAAGQSEALERVTASLEVDASSLARATSWRPRAFAIDTSTVQRIDSRGI